MSKNLFLSEVLVPSADGVVALGGLETLQNGLIVVDYASERTDTASPIQRVRLVQRSWVGLLLLYGSLVLLAAQVELQHLAEQNSILVLDFTLTFYIILESDEYKKR